MDEPLKTIGRFEILGELGRGMTGVVYEAHDPVLTRTVALKTIKPAYAAAAGEGDAFERRFESEARIAARLSHPNIVVVHDVGRDPATGILYIALERLQGETLAARVERGERFAWREALEIARQVAQALHHAHAEGVVHRDVKPANVMLLPSGQAKLMDFGIAKVEASRLTATGQFFGTPLYMSPEQASSQEVDARGDIFSLGSVLYTLLTGRHAFDGNSLIAIAQRLTTEDPPPPSTYDRGLPAEVDYVVARCLAKAPSDRYPDARSLAEDVGDVLEGLPPRHRAGWAPPRKVAAPMPPLPPGLASVAVGPTQSVNLGLEPIAAGPPAGPLASEARPARTRRGRRVLLFLAAAWVMALGVGLLLRHPPVQPVRGPSPGPPAEQRTPDPAPTPSPASRVASGEAPASAPRATRKRTPPPARVVVDFRHALKSGTLRIWVDDERVLGQPVRGEVARDLLVVKLREGVFTDVFEVEPGQHRIRVEVRWDEERRSDLVPGRFQPGETYRLEIRLGRLKRELSLRWTR